ncbi:MAG: hypothetical protein ACLFU6_08640 [Candidatus Hydrogenedentota bacterium]
MTRQKAERTRPRTTSKLSFDKGPRQYYARFDGKALYFGRDDAHAVQKLRGSFLLRWSRPATVFFREMGKLLNTLCGQRNGLHGLLSKFTAIGIDALSLAGKALDGRCAHLGKR